MDCRLNIIWNSVLELFRIIHLIPSTILMYHLLLLHVTAFFVASKSLHLWLNEIGFKLVPGDLKQKPRFKGGISAGCQAWMIGSSHELQTHELMVLKLLKISKYDNPSSKASIILLGVEEGTWNLQAKFLGEWDPQVFQLGKPLEVVQKVIPISKHIFSTLHLGSSKINKIPGRIITIPNLIKPELRGF